MPHALIMGSDTRAFDMDGGHHWPSGLACPAPPGEGLPALAMPSRLAASYLEFEPALGFAEWRLEVLSLLEAR